MFFYKVGCNFKQKVVYLMTTIVLFAFVIHFGQEVYIMQSNNDCIVTTGLQSLLNCLPQGMFFLIFIWVIFKLLYIWKSVMKESESEHRADKRRLQIYQIAFIICWLAVWIGQRIIEA